MACSNCKKRRATIMQAARKTVGRWRSALIRARAAVPARDAARQTASEER